jgi:hypothetical protein
MMISRIIFAGSSALSSKSVTFAAIMSRVRENIPMTTLLGPNAWQAMQGTCQTRKTPDLAEMTAQRRQPLAKEW